jgi:HSP20 family molecular chaperone IbpA
LPEPRKRVFNKTVEPETETNDVQDKLYIRVDLPGIPEEDIEVDELENSIEVRAYKGKTRYFKLIPIPETYQMISKEVLSGKVIITLKK